MRKILSSALAVAMMFVGMGVVSSAPLDGLQWKKRVLILFDQSRSSARLDRQIDLLRDRRPDVSDRDMVVIINAGHQDAAVAMGYVSLPAGASRNLKQRFEPSLHGITMILIGKDGEEKQRWSRVTDPQDVFDAIDAMPMRQKEMSDES